MQCGRQFSLLLNNFHRYFHYWMHWNSFYSIVDPFDPRLLCFLRPTLIELPKPSFGQFIFPSCAVVNRCGGCCAMYTHQSCRPTSVKMTPIYYYQLESSGNSGMSMSGKTSLNCFMYQSTQEQTKIFLGLPIVRCTTLNWVRAQVCCYLVNKLCTSTLSQLMCCLILCSIVSVKMLFVLFQAAFWATN